jgi:pyruvate/2-oxoglutarate dehydrogenase complex dihydrolipoamide dehydrogenase (E3) component
LVATGRLANTEGLGLERAGIALEAGSIKVDSGLRTSNRRVYAIGDAVGSLRFTHVAGHHAGLVIRNALLRLPVRPERVAVPWVTYTTPELAQVGLTEDAARARYGAIRVMRQPFAENDRAVIEGAEEGLVKVITSPRGRLYGVSICGMGAGDLIVPWTLALKRRLSIGAMAQLIAPYPTRSEASIRAAGRFFEPLVFGAKTRVLVRLLKRL